MDSRVTEVSEDIWSKWLRHRRDGDDSDARRQTSELLQPIRDRVLDHAAITEGNALLDVGCGDGLIAFGALDRTKTGTVLFSDISQELLDQCKAIAEDLGVINRCQFVRASADDLHPMPGASISVVTTRSVLIYVRAKADAFREFYRVLVPGGRISLFEPINSFRYPEPDHVFYGYDVSPVAHLARKVKAVYREAQPVRSDPMTDFDERDLLRYAEEAGFEELHLSLDADIERPSSELSWEVRLHRAPNPLAPTLQEAVDQSLTPPEAKEFLGHLKPLVEQKIGTRKLAVAYLWGTKSQDG